MIYIVTGNSTNAYLRQGEIFIKCCVMCRFFVRRVTFWDGLKLITGIRTNYDFDGTLNTVGYNNLSLATEVVISCFIMDMDLSLSKVNIERHILCVSVTSLAAEHCCTTVMTGSSKAPGCYPIKHSWDERNESQCPSQTTITSYSERSTSRLTGGVGQYSTNHNIVQYQ